MIDMRVTLDETEVLQEIKDSIGIHQILEKLGLSKRDIFNHFSIEDLVCAAYEDDPDQVKENLYSIMNIQEQSETPSIETYLKQIVEEHSFNYVIAIFRAAFRTKYTILWEEK